MKPCSLVGRLDDEEALAEGHLVAGAEPLSLDLLAVDLDAVAAVHVNDLHAASFHGPDRGVRARDGKLLEENAWDGEVTRRLALPENANRNVEVRMKRVEGNLLIEIEDQGPGFDFGRYLKIEESRLFDNHGRGIAIARSALNVEFVGSGNKAVVTIPLA